MIITLAHSLNMDVVAEGVENLTQFTELRAMGCNFVQGYLFSRPIDNQTIERFIASEQWRFS